MKRLLFLLLAVVGCASSITGSNTITVTGKAVNRKVSAALYTDNGIYFIDDVASWNESYLDKQVTVTGVLAYQANPEPEGDQLVQRMSGGAYPIIKEAKYALARE